MTTRHRNNTVKRSIAGFMAVWFSGALFLLCCANMDARASEKQSCPLAKKSSHCDKAKRDASATRFTGTSSARLVDCCGFLPAIFDKNSKIEPVQEPIAGPTGTVVPTVVRTPLLSYSSSPAAFPARLDDRQGVFILNCVFRI